MLGGLGDMKLRRVLVPLLILGGGVAIARSLIASKPEAEHHEVDVPITYVDVIEARVADHRVVVRAMGIVKAEREVVLQPEVGGRVIEQSTNLVAGGRVAKDEALVRVDPRDYSAAVASVQAELASADLQVREEATLRRVAEHEWKDRNDVGADTMSYVMREPHLEAANARVSSVRTRIAKAKRDLQRTVLRAPFEAIVIDETVDLGQMIGPQTPAARLAGTARFWVQVAVPFDELGMLEIPAMNSDADKGSAARVVHRLGGNSDAAVVRDGYAVRALANVEERGRMAQVVIAVDDPLELEKPAAQRGLPLLIGRYVNVELEGRELHGVVELPAAAVRDGKQVWVLDSDDRLRAKEIAIAWREPGKVFAAKGIASGDRIVITPLAVATDGMKVSVTPASDVVTARK